MTKETPLIVVMSLALYLAGMLLVAQNTRAQGGDNKLVKLMTGGVELLEVTPSADKCPKQKGQTIKLRVTSDSPVDVRLYVQTGYKKWLTRDFTNQKQGDEITDFMCVPKTNYKVYTRAAGTGGEWPKP